MSVTIPCPHCHQPINVEEAIGNKVERELKETFQKKIEAKQIEFENQLTKDKEALITQERIKVESEYNKKMKFLEEDVKSKEKKIEEAQQAEITLRKQKNLLEEERRSFELDKQRQLDQERKIIQEQSLKQAQEQQELKFKELEKQLDDARKSNQDMQRKLSQGSQQLQGEVLELELESMLKTEFPMDIITPIAKGIRGADILQVVCDRVGRECGTILWELKNAQWSEKFIDKLREDQRESKADIAVLVAINLPERIKEFAPNRGIWISSLKLSIRLAHALRIQLHQIHTVRLAQAGKGEKMGLLYEYVSSNQFKQRVEAMVDAFRSMQEDLEAEKRLFTKRWAKQEKNIGTLMNQTMGMHGDLSSIMGASLPELKQLQIEDGT